MLFTELFTKIANTSSREEKIELLKSHDDWFLKFLLKETYSGKPKIRVPKGLVGLGDTFLEDAHQTFVGTYSTLHKENNKKVIVNQLTRLFKILEPASAEIVVKLLARDLECGLTVSIINKAFPGLIVQFDFPKHKKATINKLPAYVETGDMFLYNKINSHDCVCYRGHKDWSYLLKSGRELKSLAYMNSSLDTFAELLGIPVSRGLCFVGKLCSKNKNLDKFIKTDAVCTDILFAPILVGRAGAFAAQDSSNFKAITAVWPPVKFLHNLLVHKTDFKNIPLFVEQYYATKVPIIELRHSSDLLGFDTSIVDVDVEVRPDFELQLDVPCLVTSVKTKEYNYPLNGKISKHNVLEYFTVLQENGISCSVANGISKDLRIKYIDTEADTLVGRVVIIRCKGYDENRCMKKPMFVKVEERLDWSSVELSMEDTQVI